MAEYSSNGRSTQHGIERPDNVTSKASSNGEITPNTGASVPDNLAAGKPSESSRDWQARNKIDLSRQIRIVKIAHMRYQHPDLETITCFLRDFGMQVAQQTDDRIWYRGYGSDPYVYYAQKGEKKFLGGAFEVESFAELEKAAAMSGATPIQELTDAPGGGHMVTVYDPEGFPVNLIFGQQSAPRGQHPEKLITNDEVDKPRVRKFNRFTAGPAAVHKLGHFGYTTKNLEQHVEWYTKTFNFVPTDILYVPLDESGKDAQTKDVAVFMHVDRGEDPVDHHTLFMGSGATSHVHHASFEVHDFDTQHLGHQWLAKQGYKPVWGVGRHILGSQIFDYWWDTTGNMIEHYADGDLVNVETPVGRMNAGDESLAIWGPEVPSTFLD